MRRCIWYKRVIKNAVGVVLLVWLLLLSNALAQSGGDYEISWSTIDGGGGTSSGGDYVLIATAGQPEAGAASGGDYELLGGFGRAGHCALWILSTLHVLPNTGWMNIVTKAMTSVTGLT